MRERHLLFELQAAISRVDISSPAAIHRIGNDDTFLLPFLPNFFFDRPDMSVRNDHVS